MDYTNLSDADAFQDSQSDLSEVQLISTSQTPLVSQALFSLPATVPLQLLLFLRHPSFLPSLRHPSSLLALWFHSYQLSLRHPGSLLSLSAPVLCCLSGVAGATALCQLSVAPALYCPQFLADLHWLNLTDATDHYHPPSLQDNKVEKFQKP